MFLEESKQVSIDGRFISGYQYIHLSQKINDHHFFTVAVNLETIETEGAYTIDKSKEWLGKTINIESHGKGFVGVITNVSLCHDNGHHGQIIMKGYSSTILLENGEHMCSWLDKDLGKIAKDATKNGKLKATVKPKYTSKIIYETQYSESNFKFLQRLAKQYHEWLYYDGEILFFGKPEKPEPMVLTYGKEVDEMEISIQTQARKYTSYTHHSLTDQNFDSKTPDAPTGLDELGQVAFNASMDTFKTPTNLFAKKRIDNKSELDSYLKNKQLSDLSSSSVVSLKTTKRGLTVGDIIDLRSEVVEGKGSILKKRHGEYIITEIHHYAAVGNHYTNSIIALPAGIEILPEPEVDFPVAQTQMATVLDNADPKKKGRVQVKMNWQTGDMKTSWLRVMTPDGGKSDKVPENRGMVFIPEKGDQVLLSFRYSDPNRPFVMGSLFNGTTGKGGEDTNKLKSITTRSGSTITFDDSIEKGKITVSDPSGNMITLDGNEMIAISAPKTIVLGADNIVLNAKEFVTVNGKNIMVKGQEVVNVEAKITGIKGVNNLILKGEGSALLTGKSVDVQGEKINSKSSQNTSIEGKVVKINS